MLQKERTKGELENRRIKPWNSGETPCWITAEAWSCKITEFLHPEWKMAEFLLKRLKSKKCLQLDLCVSHTYITCLLQALPYHTAVKLVSNHSSSEWVLSYLNQFLNFNSSDYWKLTLFKLCADEWVLSCEGPIMCIIKVSVCLIVKSYHHTLKCTIEWVLSCVSHCKNTFTKEKFERNSR